MNTDNLLMIATLIGIVALLSVGLYMADPTPHRTAHPDVEEFGQ